MNREYFKFLYKRRIYLVYFSALVIVQILQCMTALRQENPIYQFISMRKNNIYALFLGPIFCFWNLPAYTICSDIKWVLRAGSPFRCAALYGRFTALHSLLYVFCGNFIIIGYCFFSYSSIKGCGFLFPLLLFQLLFYLNCAWIYYLVMILCRDKAYMGFLAVVLYGVWDYAGEVLASYGKWVNIATSYVVCSPEVLGSVPDMFFNFSVLAGTYVCLAVAGAWLTGSRDFLDWGKAHD